MINRHWEDWEQALGSVSSGCGREGEGCFVPDCLPVGISQVLQALA